METDTEKEDDILITCALRFDGYKYLEKSGFNHEAAKKRAFYTGKPPARPLNKLALFFVLQRWLYKWGGEYLPRTDRHWKLFRELFLQVCELEIPPEYIYPGDPCYNRTWQDKFLRRLPEIRAFITRIHQSTRYTG